MDKPVGRTTRDSQAFLQEEKFETMLDLEPLIIFKESCIDKGIWITQDFKHINHVVSPDSIASLHAAGVSPQDVANSWVTPTLPACVMHHTLTGKIERCYLSGLAERSMIDTVLKGSKHAVMVQLSHLLSCMSPTMRDLIDPSLTVWDDKFQEWPPALYQAFLVAEDFTRVLQAHKVMHEYCSGTSVNQRAKERKRHLEQALDIYHQVVEIPSLNGQITLALDIALLEFGGQRYLLHKDLLLEVVNKASELFSALLYTYCLSGTTMASNTFDLMCRFWQHISCQVKKYTNSGNFQQDLERSNKGFTYLKVMEGLGVSVIIEREDMVKGWENSTLNDNLWRSVIEDRLVLDTPFRYSELGMLFMEMDVSQISECIGTVKLAGHPSIEVLNGLQKLYDRTHRLIQVDEAAMTRGIGVLKRELILNFRRKHGRYPIIDTSQAHLPPQAEQALARNRDPDTHPTTRHLSTVAAQQWAGIILGKNEEFDPIDNQIVLLKDKALGITRSKVIKLLATQTSEVPRDALGPIEERRAILNYLLAVNYGTDFKQYLAQFSSDDPWTSAVLDYLVIKLTAKELEEKPEGRFFGASPLVERNRRIVQESNVMNLMDNYFKDQLMTPNELSMVRKLYSFRHFNRVYPYHTLIQVSFDFKRWNNNMREASIDIPAADVLDRWFGTSIFGKTMKAYNLALIYYKDPVRRRFWEGQLGGIEGLNQATWSLIFLAMLKHMLEELGYYYQLTVKGDDVRAAIAIPDEVLAANGCDFMRDQILHRLQELCATMGWELNPHECFVSLSVIATSKQYQVNDTWLAASIKKACKLESLANLVFPTLEDIVSSIYSTAHSACSQATAVLPAYITATMVAARLLYRDLHPSIKSEYDLATLLIWPQCLGGPGSLPLQTFFVRGENDMLSVSMSLLRYLLINPETQMSERASAILSQHVTTDPDPTLLLTDPYALPLDIPERPQSLLKRLMKAHLSVWVKNPDLLALLSTEARGDKENFMLHLTSMRPYFAKVATAIFEASPFYILEEVISRFMESSTIFAFFSRRSQRNTSRAKAHRELSKILKAAKVRLVYWAKILSLNFIPASTFLGLDPSLWHNEKYCTTQLVHMVRENAWGFKIHGLTYPSLVNQVLIYYPADLAMLHPTWDVTHIATNIHLQHNSARFETTLESLHYAAVPGSCPWLGARTSRKLELPNVVSKVTSPTISKLMGLIALRASVPYLGPQFQFTVQSVIESLTFMDVTRLAVLEPESGGGHITHRVPINNFAMETMPNYRPNINQLVSWPADSAGILRGDQSNRTVNFAARHFMSNVLSLFPLQSGVTLPENYPEIVSLLFHYTDKDAPNYTLCPYCCDPADEEILTFSHPLMVDLTKYRSLPLVGCSTYEEHALQMNMEEALAGKVRRYAAGAQLDVDNPLHMLAASHIITHKLRLHCTKIYNSAIGADFLRVPKGTYLDAMSVTMGIRVVSKISKNLLRAMPPQCLYESLLSECIDYLIEYVCDSDVEQAVHIFSRTAPYLNPLASLFEELSGAGVMERVAQGCRMANLGPEIKWGAGCTVSGATAAETFITAHAELIDDWIHFQTTAPKITYFIKMEDNTTINENFEKKRQQLISCMVLCCNLRKSRVTIIGMWRDRLQEFLVNRPLLVQEWTTATYPDCPHPDLLSGDEDIRLGCVQEVILDAWFPQGKVTDHDDAFFIAMTYLMFNADLIFSEGQWVDDDNTPISFIQPYEIVRLTRWQDTITDQFRDDWAVTRPHLNIIAKWMTKTEIILVFDILVCLSSMDIDLVCNWLTPIHDEIALWLDNVNVRRLAVMSLSDAESVIKKQAIPIEQLAHNLTVARAQEDVVDEVDYDYQDRIHCYLPPRAAHIAPRMLLPPTLVRRDQAIDYSARIPAIGLDGTVDPPTEKFWLDSADLMRCVGIHNTSVPKYLQMLGLSGITRYLDSFTTHHMALCLADGLGGVTAALLHRFPKMYVLYNSLLGCSGKYDEIPKDASPCEPPIEVMSLPPEDMASSRVFWRGLYPGNIALVEVQDIIINLALVKHYYIPLTTMDADIDWSDNFVSARAMWWGYLRIIATVTTQSCCNFMKLFCIHHPVVYEFVHFVLSHYHHVHLYKPSASKTRSTEFFLVFSHVKNKALLLSQLPLLLTQHSALSASANYGHRMMTSMNWLGTRYMDFRDRGSEGETNMLDFYHVMAEHSGLPLNLNASLRTLNMMPLRRLHHVCLFENVILYHISDYKRNCIDTMAKVILDSNTRNAYPVLKAKRGTVLARGWAYLQMELRRYWRMLVTHAIFEHWLEDDRDPFIPDCKAIMRQALDSFLPIVRQWGAYVSCIMVKGVIFMIGLQYKECLTLLAKQVISKCTGVINAYYLAMYYIHTEATNRAPQLEAWHHNVMEAECCVVRSHRLFRETNKWLIELGPLSCLIEPHPEIPVLSELIPETELILTTPFFPTLASLQDYLRTGQDLEAERFRQDYVGDNDIFVDYVAPGVSWANQFDIEE
ncbi:RNA-dependent RNA polymerase [Oropsylla silantiewi mononega-like virus 2]|uniref:RNA-directed RNA polymerase n=1 Tax=Oropsylla silantiewi mononega-like virus 2 TaxID=2879398 RepID=A0AAV2YCM9_9VIRU|nr:RNA-dependent RNA polymerase [Oropsylla silantiewi mononega-like virus 2]DAZ89728.1 TPA_asm: RNA-dependent RNA polymerase [Oropsylla silantiewi mononega-like virus 2]